VNGFARYCCAVVHNAAAYLPDFLEYLGTEHSSIPVKHGVIGHSRDMETTTLGQYRERIAENYKGGTFRFGFLDNLSLVGTVAEEAGGFLPDILDMLEESPFLRLVRRRLRRRFSNIKYTFVFQSMPWGDLSSLNGMLPTKSNDGPILWMRPGEQSIPTVELGKSPLKRRR
jgi:hypothetical protein